jgi:leader peptidase (prepilin peptidase)/N-methyltransferase
LGDGVTVLLAAAIGAPAGWLAWRLTGLFGAEQPRPPLAAFVAANAAVFAWTAAVVPGSWILPVSLGLAWVLLCLAATDAITFRLPDPLTLPLIATGLAVSLALPDSPILGHVVGAALGYGILAFLAWVYRRWRGVDGIGMGDAKLLAAAGAWLGWRPLPSVIVIACIAAFAWIAIVSLARRRRPPARIAFGVPLSFATWAVWLYGPLIS